MFRAVKDAIASMRQRQRDRERERLRAFLQAVVDDLYDPKRQAERLARWARWQTIISN